MSCSQRAGLVALGVVALVSGVQAQSVEHAAGSSAPGVVVAAPHDGYDLYTGALVTQVAQLTSWSRVVAKGYRSARTRRWFDVNRPLQRPWNDGGFGDREETGAARQVYRIYQTALRVAAGVEEDEPLRLLVELHGHARKVEIGGRTTVVQVIEMTSTGFEKPELRRLQKRYQELVAALPEAEQVPLIVQKLQPRYRYQGRELRFYWTASGAKSKGALRPECARRALHFELPPQVRTRQATRQRYGVLLAELLKTLPR